MACRGSEGGLGSRKWGCKQYAGPSVVVVCRLEEVVMTSLRTREGITPEVSASSSVALMDWSVSGCLELSALLAFSAS